MVLFFFKGKVIITLLYGFSFENLLLLSKMIKINSRCFVVRSFFGCFVFKRHSSDLISYLLVYNEIRYLHFHRLRAIVLKIMFTTFYVDKFDIDEYGLRLATKNMALALKAYPIFEQHLSKGIFFGTNLRYQCGRVLKDLTEQENMISSSISLKEDYGPSDFEAVDDSFDKFFDDFLKYNLTSY